MKKAICILLLAAMLCGLLSAGVQAQVRTSDYIGSRTAALRQGSAAGGLVVSYNVSSKAGIMTQIGVSLIQVYNANGTHYRTIYGSTANGLIKLNATSKSGSYSMTCVPGNSYYCIVTFKAMNANGLDTKTSTTATVVAHP